MIAEDARTHDFDALAVRRPGTARAGGLFLFRGCCLPGPAEYRPYHAGTMAAGRCFTTFPVEKEAGYRFFEGLQHLQGVCPASLEDLLEGLRAFAAAMKADCYRSSSLKLWPVPRQASMLALVLLVAADEPRGR